VPEFQRAYDRFTAVLTGEKPPDPDLPTEVADAILTQIGAFNCPTIRIWTP
jgi:hypothetical protein